MLTAIHKPEPRVNICRKNIRSADFYVSCYHEVQILANLQGWSIVLVDLSSRLHWIFPVSPCFYYIVNVKRLLAAFFLSSDV
jgi:hypothetical protein